MKLMSYWLDATESYGVQTDNGIIDIPTYLPDAPATLSQALDEGYLPTLQTALPKQVDQYLSPNMVQLTAPIGERANLVALAGNYAEHIREFSPAGGDVPDDPRSTTTPRPFLMPSGAVTAHGAEVPWPVYCNEVDYEAELAIVIGSLTRRVSPEEAKDCIAGYTIANDISGRSVTHKTGRAERQPKDGFFDWLNGKWADGFFPLGPALVTADEIADPQNLDISLTVNGQPRQQANTNQMIFNVYEIVSFVSQIMTLFPGDVIATGTPSGVGKATGRLLQPDDVVNIQIESLGELTCKIGPKPNRFYQPCLKP